MLLDSRSDEIQRFVRLGALCVGLMTDIFHQVDVAGLRLRLIMMILNCSNQNETNA